MLRKIFVTALILFVLTNFAFAAEKQPKKSVWQPELRVGIKSDVTQVGLKVSAPCIMIDPATKKTLKKIPANKNFVVDFAQMKTKAVEIRPEKILLKDLKSTIDGREYFGGVRVNKLKASLTVINLVPTEEYLRGVVGEEMSPAYPLEALKAQAVAARSFALKNRGRHEKDGYDLCATTHCQVYAGFEDFEIVNKAVDETRGQVLVFKEKIADANFHADSGGMTEAVADVWGTNVAYLVPVKELLELTAPWTKKFSAKDFASRFGDGFGDLKSIKLSKLTVGKKSNDRTDSGRVKSVQLVGTKKTLTVTGSDMRRKFSLPSTLFDMKLDGGEVVFTGYGSGHGVGMSQQGAKSYALKDWKFDKILSHYYSGTKLKKLY